MKPLASLFLISAALALPIHAQPDPAERLGTVAFANSCAPSVQVSFLRGIALLHDFWYEEANRQFSQIAAADPTCAMAHWGIAMSIFHQIWNRPAAHTMAIGWDELQKAQSPPARTARERAYISALRTFYQPGPRDFEARADAYSAAMAQLFQDYPADVDAAAFYALSLLASAKGNDTSLSHEHQALAILEPLVAKYPNHPGLAHYIIHACDNPVMAAQGLNAAERYGIIAPSAAHSSHMPGHIFARLGMWQPDIDANLASVAAGQRASKDHPGMPFDQLHAYDFLLYAYLQSAQDANAKATVETTAALLNQAEAMPDMHGGMDMSEMIPRYRGEFPIIYALEMRDWKSAAALTPPTGAPPDIAAFTYWARIIANGHLHRAEAARADLATYQSINDQVKRSPRAFMAETTGWQIEQSEVIAWSAFAEGNQDKALIQMRAAADLQDKVGQGEVDIPAREMLADMFLAFEQPQQALEQYKLALRASPNRFNGLFNAGRAAELSGDKAQAAKYYATLLKITNNGSQSTRVEFTHVKTFLASSDVAQR